jgi:conjugal transfer pilus assembly protein TraU
VSFMTELDPLWNNDEMSFILNPEAVLFNNPIAQAACAADCLAASLGFPLDPLFWCLGCQVGLHPLSGTIKPHESGLASSTVAVQRAHAMLHRALVTMNVSTPAAMCFPIPAPIMQKTWYKTQLLRPIPTPLMAHPYGRSTTLWGTGKEFPIEGEDFAYMIWRRRVCCAY